MDYRAISPYDVAAERTAFEGAPRYALPATP